MLSVAKRLKCQECRGWYEIGNDWRKWGLPKHYPYCSGRCKNVSLVKMMEIGEKIKDESEMEDVV